MRQNCRCPGVVGEVVAAAARDKGWRVHLLENPVRDYAWGSRTHLPRLLGREPDGRPWAELWMGAHPTAPSRLADGTSLRDAIAADADALLGRRLHSVFGDRLPFLMKVLAAAEPLSLQVHPTTERARVRAAEQDAAGIARDAPERTYPDPQHKPEMLFALTRFEGMAGFRDPVRTAAILRGLGLGWLDEMAAELADTRTPSRTLREVVTALLERKGADLERDLRQLREAALSAEVVSHSRRAGRRQGVADDPTLVERESVRVYAAVARLVAQYPADPGVLVTLLLNHVVLAAGEAMFVDAGVIHAYTSGFGVEIMAESDNVLRAGLTVKHVDVPELLEVADFRPIPPPLWDPTEVDLDRTTALLFSPPVEEFELLSLHVREPVTLRGGPQVLLCLDGFVEVSCDGGSVALGTGSAVFLGDADGAATVSGGGRLVVGRTPPDGADRRQD